MALDTCYFYVRLSNSSSPSLSLKAEGSLHLGQLSTLLPHPSLYLPTRGGDTDVTSHRTYQRNRMGASCLCTPTFSPHTLSCCCYAHASQPPMIYQIPTVILGHPWGQTLTPTRTLMPILPYGSSEVRQSTFSTEADPSAIWGFLGMLMTLSLLVSRGKSQKDPPRPPLSW